MANTNKRAGFRCASWRGLLAFIAAWPCIAFTAPPVTIQFVLPGSPPSAGSTQTDPFPLVLRASWSLKREVGLYVMKFDDTSGPDYPKLAVFADPDDCLDQWLYEGEVPRIGTCLNDSPALRYMEFLQSTAYRIDRQFESNDNWPGLVLLSNRGLGLVLDDNFDRPQVRAQKNLAGHLNWVWFEESDSRLGSSVAGGTQLSSFSVAPLIWGDGAVGICSAGSCSAPDIFRVDGGPVQTGPSIQSSYRQLVEQMEFELRAFVVSGRAPDTLLDKDNDTDIDTTDARLAGYAVISNEAVVRYRMPAAAEVSVLPPECAGSNWLTVDLDGNGQVLSADDCLAPPPPGPGAIKQR